MLTDRLKSLNNFKGSLLEKVNGLMKYMQRTINGATPVPLDKGADDTVFKYDYDSYCLKKRIYSTLSGLSEARKRLNIILPDSEINSLFAYSNSMIMKGGYNHEIDKFNLVALSSAIWILDELTLAGKIDEIYQYLPVVNENNCSETFCWPASHPMYDDDLIFSLVYLIRHRNSSADFSDDITGSLVWEKEKPDSDEKSLEYRAAFDSIIALLNPESIEEATKHFEDNVWEFYRISFSIMTAAAKKEKLLVKEREKHQGQMTEIINQTLKPKNILLMSNYLTKDFAEKKAEKDHIDNELERLDNITFTDISIPNDREKLAKRLKGIISKELANELVAFRVDDPFETAFALLYLLDTNSNIPWYYYGSISVGYTMCDQLPFDTKPEMPQKPIKLTEWNAALYQHRYKGYRFPGRLDASGEPVKRGYAKNLSQLIFSNTLSLVPRVVPEQANLANYYNDLGELSEHEKEAYSLLSYTLVAGQLHTRSLHFHQTMQFTEKLLEDIKENETALQDNDDVQQLKEENDRLRAKNRELVEMVSGVLADQKSNSKQVQLLQQQLVLQEKELSDLREAVYLLENNNIGEEPVDDSIKYPYKTSGKIVSFGGHDTWLKEMRKKLPNVTFVAPDSLPNIDLIRNADAIWLQTNCISHSDFFRIINTVRLNGIPLRYFSFSGPEKCAEQLVKSTN